MKKFKVCDASGLILDIICVPNTFELLKKMREIEAEFGTEVYISEEPEH